MIDRTGWQDYWSKWVENYCPECEDSSYLKLPKRFAVITARFVLTGQD